ELRLHDSAVRRGEPRQREQGVVPPRERRLDSDERRPGGSRVDGQRRRPEGVAGARERGARPCDRASGRRAGGRVSRTAPAGPRRSGGARVRAHAVPTSRRRSAAGRRHRRGRVRDPGRFARRRGRGRGRRARLRLPGLPDEETSLPRRPFRDSAILYGVLAAIILVVGIVTGGGVAKTVVIAVAFFVVATGWSWWRFK